MPDPIRVIVRMRDGRVVRGYTPAFDPKDRSIWCSPAPNSPAGTMIPFSRIKIVILEPAEGDPAPELPNITAADPSCRIRILFGDGEDMVGSQKVRIPGVGYWLEPSDARGFEARAFVPEDVPSMVEMVDSGGVEAGSALPDKGWKIGAETQPERIPDLPPDDDGETFEVARLREAEAPTPQPGVSIIPSERPTEAPPADKTDPSLGLREDETPTNKPSPRMRAPARPPRPVKTPSPARPPPPSKTPLPVRGREKTDSEAPIDPTPKDTSAASKSPSVPTLAIPVAKKTKTGPTGKAHVADISTTQPDVPAPSLEDLGLDDT